MTGLNDYCQFLAAKAPRRIDAGFEIDPAKMNPALFPFQNDLTRWALRKGRAALFADCGLGKTAMQLEWAAQLPGRTLILAPLAVAQQTVAEAAKLGYAGDVHYARSQADAHSMVTVTNYEMLSHFNPAEFVGVVLDESSILKAQDGKTRQRLIDAFAETPYRLCCTATPAPNDIAEFANHAEFLGICSREEMLATYFVHDDAGWRVKGHAVEAFYRWLAGWGMSLSKPSDLGYSDSGYLLPELSIVPEIVPANYVPDGQLFATGLKGVTDRAQVRRGTLMRRVERAIGIIEDHPDEQCIAWCGLNDESTAIAEALGDEAIEVTGSQSIDEKASAIQAFLRGEKRILVTKPRVAGFGMNFQNASRMVFVGLSDSYESYYQCLRRCWRFGQMHPVTAHIVLSDLEQPIYENVLAKEQQAATTHAALIRNAIEYERAEIAATGAHKEEYMTETTTGKSYILMLGDCVERLREVPDESVDFSVYSPPFSSLYTYSASDRDMGNSDSHAQFFEHYSHLLRELLRVMKPGRNVAVHCQQLSTTLITHGVIGMYDFRGDLIRAHEAAGFIYHGEVCIDKDPQAQAIRTHAKGLLFVQLHKDASWLRPAMADYILVFRKPGENAVPVHPDITNDDWIEWARPIWYGIDEGDTLNVRVARGDRDERHICALQLPTIERCVRLWSNTGEMVLSPFMGIGSEGVVAVRTGRRFTGVELKPEYYRVAVRNIESTQAQGQMPMFANTATDDLLYGGGEGEFTGLLDALEASS